MTDYLQLLKMNYEEAIQYLQAKYGRCPLPYFVYKNSSTHTKGITRTSEGLYIHHVLETVVDNLSSKDLNNPRLLEYAFDLDRIDIEEVFWEMQQPEYLVYCDLLEHLILHIKINTMRNAKEGYFCIDGVINHLIPLLNEMYYKNIEYTGQYAWLNNIKAKIIPHIEIYHIILQEWVNDIYVKHYYTVDKLLKLKR